MSLVVDDKEYAKLDLEVEEFVRRKIAEKRSVRATSSRSGHRGSRHEKSIVCKHWLRGLCKKNDYCEFLHEYDLSKMPPCHFFTTYGSCSNNDCLFLHLEPEEFKHDCPWYARGFCKHGPKCRNRHVRNETCQDYVAGFCPKGPECKFGHPKFERPTDDGWLVPPFCSQCGGVGHRAAACDAARSTAPATEPDDVALAAPVPQFE